jgi:hypothetical protein
VRYLLLLLVTCCGVESLLGGDRFEPTPAPRVRLGFTAPAGASTVEAYDPGERLLGAVPAAVGLIDLGDKDLANLRLVARAETGAVVGRATVGDATARTEVRQAGALDAAATAASLLVDARTVTDGLALGATPPPVVSEVVRQAAGADAALVTFRDLVAELLPGDAFRPLGSDLREGFSDERYAAALAAAVALVGVPIVCDPALVRVMFAVDVSGQGLDGNGARQLIRQPPKEGRVFLGLTVDDSSSIGDAAGLLPQKITPNDPAFAMFDDGTGGDEAAGDGIYTRVVTLPRGMRIIYKYTDGSAGEGFTQTEEWPGNARILEVADVVTSRADGKPDCLVIRRDSFGDEASNKNFTSLAEGLKGAGGALGWDVDLGGPAATPLGDGRVAGGVGLDGGRAAAPLSPAGIPEARENGVCTTCPAPLVLAPGDEIAPTLLGASFLSTAEIEVRFSEAMEFAASSDPTAYLVVDTTLRALPILGAASLGDRVRLRVNGPDLGEVYTLHVRRIPDASSNQNELSGEDAVTVGEDVSPPRPLLARAGSRKDLDPAAILADPTAGDLLTITFSEELDPATAEDIAHYRVENVFGIPLAVKAAFLRGTRVHLVTDAQEKRMRYTVAVSGVRDFSRNLSPPVDPLPFEGFGLYRMTVGVVPGHAWTTRNGSARGIPRGERLYLTGTPLAVARNPGDGADISIGGRTDVTGVPEFELLAGAEQHVGKPVHTLTILVPPGVYAWKAAHGIPGEWTDPPNTLEKVSKSLGTTNDPTGVNVDPVTLVGRDGVSYDDAVISLDGKDRPGPTVLFKRENPDEICVVKDRDVTCPTIVVGTWRDLDEFLAGGVLEDYDDGEPEVPPARLVADTRAPTPIFVSVRDSESLRVSFDEEIAAGATVTATAGDLSVVEVQARFPGAHELVVRTAAQTPGARYTLAVSGLADTLGNTHAAPLAIGWTSPSTFMPFTPFDDTAPPVLLGAVPESPTRLRVRFDERVAQTAADPARYSVRARDTSSPPSVLAAELAGNGKEVILTTTSQPLMGQLTLTASGIADQASPANTLATASVDFVGFGDLTAPSLISARAIGTGLIALVFDEALDTTSALSAASYTVSGVTLAGVEFSGDPTLASSMFDPADADLVRTIVLLRTSPITAGATHTVSAQVSDLSGNDGGGSRQVTGVATAPTVDVILEVLLSDTATVAGAVPPRALSPSRLDAEREGLFLVGVGGFPAEGSPLNGAEPALELVSSSPRIYRLVIQDVPLGTQLEWKLFASYTVAWKQAHPQDAAAAFADALAGPSAFSDGQEFPGNENGARIVADLDGDGVVVIRHLFGDETTYKKLSTSPAFLWVAEEHDRDP